MLEDDEYYDEELDLCLDLLSKIDLEPNLYELFKKEQKKWIQINEIVCLDQLGVSNKIQVMWLPTPISDGYSAMLILFINQETLEVSNSIYYNYKNLLDKFT